MVYFESYDSYIRVNYCIEMCEGRKTTEAVSMVSVPLIRYLIKLRVV